MYNFPIGVIVDSFRTDIKTAIVKASELGADGIQMYATSGNYSPEKLKGAKSDLCIMHPLPRVNEISVAIDEDPRACYFKQVLNGKYMRMALIMKLLGIEV